MWTPEVALKTVRPCFEKLTEWGFSHHEGIYRFTTDILEGSFSLHITVNCAGETAFRVVDRITGEDYTLLHDNRAVGAFVGMVRTACEEAFTPIVAACYEPAVFQEGQAHDVVRYIYRTYGDRPEFLWEKTPGNAIFREKTGNKWYAALLTVARQTLGLPGPGEVQVLNLKAPPDQVAARLDGVRYLPAYHMNKVHWYTVLLDGCVSTDTLCRHIDTSHCAVSG